MGSSLTHTASFHWVSLKSVYLFLFNLTHKQTSRRTGRSYSNIMDKQSLKYASLSSCRAWKAVLCTRSVLSGNSSHLSSVRLNPEISLCSPRRQVSVNEPLSRIFVILLLCNGLRRLMDGSSTGLPEEQTFYLDINLLLWDRHACLASTKPSKLLSLRKSWPSPEPLEAAMAGARVMTCEIHR